MKPRTMIFVALAALCLTRLAAAQEKPDLATQGYELMKTYCYRCHGLKQAVPDLDVLKRNTLTASRDDDVPFLTPGDLDKSYIWQRVGVDRDMPPEDEAQMSDEEIALLETWIQQGAPFPEISRRPFKGLSEVMVAVRDHLQRTAPADRPFTKYFTMLTFYNDPQMTTKDLRNGPAALSKLINSLSWKRQLVLPEAVDEDGLVYAVDIRRLDWHKRDLWTEILKEYPYGLNYEEHLDETVRTAAVEVIELSGDKMPFVRADWFIATVARPPLYHLMLNLPETVEPLEKLLNVNAEGDFNDNLLARAGFATSGVSDQNRIVDRHYSIYGAYWKSYDFKPRGDKSDIFRFPLGPEFEGNAFSEQAFEHDGGEMIFNLPNGLQGYYLTDNKGNRIDVGPTEVVHDSLRTSGGISIVNGLSCMACHQQGIKPFKDSMRRGRALFKEAMVKVQKLVPRQEEMDLLVKKDQERFLTALESATGPFLKVEEDADRNIAEFPEPVGKIATRYVKDLGPAEVALDLGLSDGKELEYIVRGNRRLRRVGLGPLANGQTIKRDVWSTLGDGKVSPFHLMAEELEQGTPFVQE